MSAPSKSEYSKAWYSMASHSTVLKIPKIKFTATSMSEPSKSEYNKAFYSNYGLQQHGSKNGTVFSWEKIVHIEKILVISTWIISYLVKDNDIDTLYLKGTNSMYTLGQIFRNGY